MRLDVWLVKSGRLDSREKARRWISEGNVSVNGSVVTKPSHLVSGTETVELSELPRYVGRGGYKLEAALEKSRLNVDGCTALDVGASTGGFTQCMLERGAKRVVAVDVGSGQLHPSLREDARVCCLESTDVRNREAISPYVPQNGFDVASVDVSFISLQCVLPTVCDLLKDGGHLVCLIKPQFEVGRTSVGKGGIVRDLREHRRVLVEWSRRFPQYRLSGICLLTSPILGGDGNGEYLAVLKKEPAEVSVEAFTLTDVEQAIEQLRKLQKEKQSKKGTLPCV